MDDRYRARLVEAFADLLVREHRTDVDYTEIAARMETDLKRPMRSQTVGRWLREFVQPRDPAERKSFARALGVTTDWLFYEEGERRPVVQPGPTEPSPQDRAEFVNGELDAARAERERAAAKKAAGGATGRSRKR